MRPRTAVRRRPCDRCFDGGRRDEHPLVVARPMTTKRSNGTVTLRNAHCVTSALRTVTHHRVTRVDTPARAIAQPRARSRPIPVNRKKNFIPCDHLTRPHANAPHGNTGGSTRQ